MEVVFTFFAIAIVLLAIATVCTIITVIITKIILAGM